MTELVPANEPVEVVLTPELERVRLATIELAASLEPCGLEAIPVVVETLEAAGIELPEFVKMALGSG